MSLGHPTDILLTEKAFMLTVSGSVMSYHNCFLSFAFLVKSFTFLKNVSLIFAVFLG